MLLILLSVFKLALFGYQTSLPSQDQISWLAGMTASELNIVINLFLVAIIGTIGRLAWNREKELVALLLSQASEVSLYLEHQRHLQTEQAEVSRNVNAVCKDLSDYIKRSENVKQLMIEAVGSCQAAQTETARLAAELKARGSFGS